MKAIILHGSPRKNGNTIKITERFIDGLKLGGVVVDFIDTTKLNISPCLGCLKCEGKDSCVIKDEMTEIYSKIINSDIIVLSSPVYFASFSAQLKTVIDRCQYLHSRKYVLKLDAEINRDGYLIFSAGSKNRDTINSMELSAKFFMLSANAKLQESIFALDLDNVPIENRRDVLDLAYEVGYKASKKNNKIFLKTPK